MKKIAMLLIALMVISVGLLSGCLGSLADMLASVDRRNPTYQKMVDFIQEDTTNYNSYDFSKYVCDNFEKGVIANARDKGYNAGYVTLDCTYVSPYYGTLYGHAIVCFDTTDKGLYFVEPQWDAIFSKTDMNYMLSTGYYTIFGYEYSLRGYTIDWHHTTSHTEIPYWDY